MSLLENYPHGYIGKGERVHILVSFWRGTSEGYAFCGCGGDIIETTEDATCKICLAALARKERNNGGELP